MGHYYTKDGEAQHEQPTKAGAKNKTRPTTIADARKQNLLPSVTTIFETISKPFLTEWQIGEALKVAYACPAIGWESEEEWIKHVREKANEQVGAAADLGTAVHAAIEAALAGQKWDQILKPHVQPALDAVGVLKLTEQASEAITVNTEIGYAGCVDLTGWMLSPEDLGFSPTIPVIADFKTKKTKVGEKIATSETYPWQLAAYHASKFGTAQRELQIHPFARACNIYISSTEPGRCETVWYEKDELEHAWECFKAAHKLWCLRNKYNPCQ